MYVSKIDSGELLMDENKNLNPHVNHRARLRETFRKVGIDKMPDHNVLELLLFYSIPRKDTNEIAHRLLATFGSLDRVFNAPYERLLEVEGMGENSALLISLVPGLCRRYLESSAEKKINLSDAEKMKEFVAAKFYGCDVERFYLVCLDAMGTLINCCELGTGTTGTVVIDKRATLETAFRNNADTVIFAHNHPNGIAAPSKEDINMTSDFVSLFKKVGIRLADHIIVGGTDVISLAETQKFRPIFL